jgi:hypothetical protein
VWFPVLVAGGNGTARLPCPAADRGHVGRPAQGGEGKEGPVGAGVARGRGREEAQAGGAAPKRGRAGGRGGRGGPDGGLLRAPSDEAVNPDRLRGLASAERLAGDLQQLDSSVCVSTAGRSSPAWLAERSSTRRTKTVESKLRRSQALLAVSKEKDEAGECRFCSNAADTHREGQTAAESELLKAGSQCGHSSHLQQSCRPQGGA